MTILHTSKAQIKKELVVKELTAKVKSAQKKVD